jgi:hypothetical protein
MEKAMHPRIQARRDSVGLARKQIIVRAIGDLCASMEFAAGKIERVTGSRPPELTEMADAYRLVMARLVSEPVTDEEVAAVSERIHVSAEVALVFIRTIVDQITDDIASTATIH